MKYRAVCPACKMRFPRRYCFRLLTGKVRQCPACHAKYNSNSRWEWLGSVLFALPIGVCTVLGIFDAVPWMSAVAVTGASCAISFLLYPYISKYDLVVDQHSEAIAASSRTGRSRWGLSSLDPRTHMLPFLGLVAVAVAGLWYARIEHRKAVFLDNLRLVDFSTSMIGYPREDQERAAYQRAEELGIDLFAAYRHHLTYYSRYSLAWMLITKESDAYYQFARENVNSIPWPEARIWRFRRNEKALSQAYREKLFDLLQASPTSEAQLAVASEYHKQGRLQEAEDIYYVAMTKGLFWDSLDAADGLLDSERYRADVSRHLFAMLRTTDEFISRAAFSLCDLHGGREELEPLIQACRREGKDGPNRKLLVEELTRLADEAAGTSQPVRRTGGATNERGFPIMPRPEEDKGRPGAMAWRIIEPYCDAVSIHEGPEVFLRGFEQLPEPSGHLLAVWWCDAEVCNGGFYQFFSNSTGVLAPEAAKGFRAVGLAECADLVQAGIAKFGEPYPRDRAARRAALEALKRPGDKRKDWDPFGDLDNRYYAAKERLDFERTIDEYARGYAD